MNASCLTIMMYVDGCVYEQISQPTQRYTGSVYYSVCWLYTYPRSFVLWFPHVNRRIISEFRDTLINIVSASSLVQRIICTNKSRTLWTPSRTIHFWILNNFGSQYSRDFSQFVNDADRAFASLRPYAYRSLNYMSSTMLKEK